MRSFAVQWGIHCIFISAISFMIVLVMNPEVFAAVPALKDETLQSFKTIFISIILEALPFIMLGVLISSFMQIFLSEQMIQRFTPRHPLLGILFACLLGFLFPVCECGLIPVIRRLIAKGMPLYIAVVFILAGPIVNPIVYAATYMAFKARPEMLYARMGLAVLAAAMVGLFVYRFVAANQLKHSASTLYADAAGEAAGHSHDRGSKVSAMLEHAAGEFFEMGKYLILGSMVTAGIQALIPRSDLVSIGQDPIVSHLFMMGFAYVLSLCSTSDAFVAASFANTFSAGSLLTFLVFGPMLDIKSSLMLLSVFRTRFVLLLALLITVSVLSGSLLISRLYFQ